MILSKIRPCYRPTLDAVHLELFFCTVLLCYATPDTDGSQVTLCALCIDAHHSTSFVYPYTRQATRDSTLRYYPICYTVHRQATMRHPYACTLSPTRCTNVLHRASLAYAQGACAYAMPDMPLFVARSTLPTLAYIVTLYHVYVP